MVTRLGLYGGPRSPYGSFAGKEEGEVIVSLDTFFGAGDDTLQEDDLIILAVIKDFMKRVA